MQKEESYKKNILVSPVVKWVGGKRQLLPEIKKYIPSKISTYVEPFLGGGAVLFELQPKKAIVNDFNSELINVYQVIKDNPEELILSLESHKQLNNEDYYYKIRGLDRTDGFDDLSNVEKASRILYLNKTCYNGLFRVNRAGQFNTPYGKYKNPNIVNEVTIRAMSKYLNKNNVKLMTGDYKEALKNLRKGAFVYFDPPYLPISSSSSFTGYTENGFEIDKQIELRDECKKLAKRGIDFLLSNSYSSEILDLYSDKSFFKIEVVKATRNVNSISDKRGEINEVLITNVKQ
ncbi:DNA adenine methylase [Streptococcus uberis]|uniref:Site-specific DNA-methyltransferase (adenine-specific) n=1 Tax=Streptococcus parauberis TaxID=1348 RepID=A0A854WN75_9STRE|nr:DNA adenine methylase [Streptococcus parauberis]PCH10642.1 Modification methylase DpnIIA [Streptococcus parauberis]